MSFQRNLLREDIQNLSFAEIIEFLNENYPDLNVKKSLKLSNFQEKNVVLGEKGEKNVIEIIKNNKQGFIVYKNNNKHSGDLVVYREDYPAVKIMIEVKNYTNKVPQEQYFKFIDDLENTQYAGGVFISNKEVVGHDSFEVTSKTMLLTDYENILPLIYLFWSKIIICSYYKFFDKEVNLKNCHKRISSTLETITIIKNSVKNLRKIVNKEADSIEKHCFEVVREINDELVEINKIMFGESVEIILDKVSFPENSLLFINKKIKFKERLLKFINESFSSKPISVLQQPKKDELEVNLDGKLLKIKLLKTKVVLVFKPKIHDFTNFKDIISFENELAKIIIDSSNCESDILERIKELF